MLSKKVILFLSLLPSILYGCANPFDPRGSSCMAQQINDNRVYAGVSLAHSNLVGTLNRNLTVDTQDRVSSLGQKGTTPGVFLGYSAVSNGFLYIGGEVFYYQYNLPIEKDENTFPGFVQYSTFINKTNSYGGVAKLGLAHRDNLFYGKLGIVSSRFSLGFRDKSNVPNLSDSRVVRERGIVMGAGIDYLLSYNWAIGLDYEVTTYKEMNFNANEVGSFKFKPTNHNTNLRLKYIF